MRVLVLNWRDAKNPTAGGAELVVDNILRGLASLGHDVTLFTSEFKGCRKREKTGYANIIRKGSMGTVYVHAFMYLLRHRKDFDFVIESVSAVPFFTPLCFDKNRIIMIPHHIVGKVIFEEVSLPKALLAYSAEKLIPSVYRGVDFIAVSDPVKSELVKFGIDRRKITTCRFGLYSLFRLKRMKKYGRPTIITVARLMKYKRVDLLLDIFKRVTEKTDDAEFIVVGSGKESGRLRDYAHELGIESKVRFTGWVSESEKEELLSRSWVFVTASEREGFGMSALEAESSGTPAVAYNIGGLSEAVKDKYSGFLVEEDDIASFADKVILLLSNRPLLLRMSKNGITYGKQFSRNTAISAINDIIKRKSA